MLATVLLSLSGACAASMLSFHFHWFCTGARWAGWAATGCMAAGVALLIAGARAA